MIISRTPLLGELRLNLMTLTPYWWIGVDMFYTLPNGAALVKDATYTLDVFVYSMLRSATPLGYPAAAAFLQSVFGFFLILITNFIVRRTRPELALF
jgi:putative aldouronate transport system permease protein